MGAAAESTAATAAAAAAGLVIGATAPPVGRGGLTGSGVRFRFEEGFRTFFSEVPLPPVPAEVLPPDDTVVDCVAPVLELTTAGALVDAEDDGDFVVVGFALVVVVVALTF